MQESRDLNWNVFRFPYVVVQVGIAIHLISLVGRVLGKASSYATNTMLPTFYAGELFDKTLTVGSCITAFCRLMFKLSL